MSRIIAIIQARMSSTRLPGKIMLKLGNKSVLANVVERVRKCPAVSDVVVATTILPADDAVIEECNKIGVTHFRGSSDNVLERYYLAANMAKADVIIRITSDCPFIDPEMLGAMLTKFSDENPDYLSNVVTRCYPRGFDMEIFTFAALEESYEQAKLPHEQEHVTPYIYQHPEKFTLSGYHEDDDNSDLRVTLDTIEDWQVIENVYNTLAGNNPDFLHKDVIKYLRENPDIAKINQQTQQKKLGE